MEGVRGELINVESKTVNELRVELVEAYKTIAEKEAEVKRLLDKISVLEKRLQSEGGAGDSAKEPEVELSLIREMKTEQIIPENCWAAIFRNLNEEDLLSCRQVCRIFNKFLYAREFREKWKLAIIARKLIPYLKTSDPDSTTWEQLPNARLVCRPWRHSIDKYASEVHRTGFSPLPQTSKLPLLTRFETFEDMEEFQERFGGCKTNPFPSKSVCILRDEVEDYTQDTYNTFIEKVGYLLVQFGQHIFKLQLNLVKSGQNFSVFGPDPLTLCKLIRRITIHLPNLKELLIDGIGNNEDEDEEVASYVAENALVALPKLRSLNIGPLDERAADYLLDAFGPQLTTVEIYKNLISRIQIPQLKNVRELSLAIDKPNDTLVSLRFLQSPLNHLKMTFRNLDWTLQTLNVHMDKIMRNLKHLPIEILEIQAWMWDRMNLAEAGIDIEEYNNTSIKTLIIDIGHQYPNVSAYPISFNFLQALTKLENLEFKLLEDQLWISHPDESLEVVKLNEYLFGEEGSELPYHSNIWEKLPSLKILVIFQKHHGVVNKLIFTRQKYDRFMIIPEWFEC